MFLIVASAIVFLSTIFNASEIYSDASDNSQVRQLIRDVVKYNSKILPTPMVTAFVCWPEAEAVKLAREMSQHNIFVVTYTGCQKIPSVLTIPSQVHTLNILDEECSCVFDILEQANRTNLFRYRTRWHIIDASDEGTLQTKNDSALDSSLEEHPRLIRNESWGPRGGDAADGEGEPSIGGGGGPSATPLGRRLESLNVHVASEVSLAKRTSGRGFRLLDVHRTGPGARLAVWSVLGEWRAGCAGLQAAADPVTAVRRANLHTATVGAATAVTNNQTLDHMTDIHDRHVDSITRMNYALLETAVETMNATLKLVIRPTWGYLVDGKWTGVVGELVAGNADIAAAGMLLYSARQDVMDYAVMTTPTKLGFVFRRPPLSSVANVFTLPFSGAVWLCAAAMVALCAAALYAALRWEHQLGRRPRRSAPAVTWGDVALLSLGAVCQQGSPIESRGTPGRIVSLLLFVAVIFLYTSYSAYIVALLQSTTGSIRTLEDLLHSRLELAVEDIVYNRYYFEAEKEPLRRELYRKKIAPPGKPARFLSLEDGVERVRQGFFAFHFETGKGFKLVQETFTEEEKCGLDIISFIQVVDAYMALRKGTPYREIIVLAYRKLMERGFQKRAWNRYYTKKPECSTRGSSFVYVGLIDCYPAMLVLIFGMLISLGMLLLEVCLHRRLQKFPKEQDLIN